MCLEGGPLIKGAVVFGKPGQQVVTFVLGNIFRTPFLHWYMCSSLRLCVPRGVYMKTEIRGVADQHYRRRWKSLSIVVPLKEVTQSKENVLCSGDGGWLGTEHPANLLCCGLHYLFLCWAKPNRKHPPKPHTDSRQNESSNRSRSR